LLVDGEEYFPALRAALLQARKQILIAGWDFDSRVVLPPPASRAEADELLTAPSQLADLLGYLVRTRPELEIHVIRWDYHWMFRDDREADTRQRLEAVGVHFHDDRGHPVTGCVHHKLVVIDDVLAFCGGMDLTHARWDTCSHDPKDVRRRNHAGAPYMPVHDTQLCVSGPVAADLGDYLRENWPAPESVPERVIAAQEFWPAGLRVDFEEIRTGICRTRPATPDGPAIREIESFYLDAIAATERFLYIENQYFTSTRIAQAIAEQCAREPVLEGLLVGMERPKTLIELHTMGYGLTQFSRVLELHGAAARVPMVAAVCDKQAINMHSKLALFDDRWLTCGSANLNRRSMGFDIECNLALEADTPSHRERMSFLRTRLLAEHLGMQTDEVREALRIHGMARLTDVAHRARRLVPQQPEQLQPRLGPVLAPFFDREEGWLVGRTSSAADVAAAQPSDASPGHGATT
jgi:phospholipase D1/2